LVELFLVPDLVPDADLRPLELVFFAGMCILL
jgi:hypothetical protein